MTVISLDSITKNILLKKSYSLHWWIDFMVYLKDGLRIISADDIPCFRAKILTLNSNHAIEIPNDYQDYISVSVMEGQKLRPLIEDDSLNLIPNYDSNFDIQPYNQGPVAVDATINTPVYYGGFLSAYWWSVNWNIFGENTGRQFGGVGSMSDTFRVNKARNEIKINEDLCTNCVVLEYVSNGMDSDSATQIDSYAQECLEAYAMWQFKENNRTYNLGDARVAKESYVEERQILRARLSDLTIDKFKRIVQINSIGMKY